MYKILIIEDQPEIRDNLATLLDAEGYEVLEAADGEAGISLALSELPDLILCDIVMPQMDGYEVVQKIRNNFKTALIPCVFLTAKARDVDRKFGMQLGADDYLTKPFTASDLLSCLSARLERYKLVTEFLTAQENHFRLQLLKQIPNQVGNLLNKGIGCFYLLVDEEDEEERQRLKEDGIRTLAELYALWVVAQKQLSQELTAK